jgi:hypothetical protein
MHLESLYNCQKAVRLNGLINNYNKICSHMSLLTCSRHDIDEKLHSLTHSLTHCYLFKSSLYPGWLYVSYAYLFILSEPFVN